ncbi:YfiR family protein [Sphingobium nicotianae]|uniref:YfiR family protein n=1 Tax=Sphingobium nicotianae TaxID=2782607 RepID=UPI0020323DA8|nr:YfiR family protein [Sphingobium nicotianae]
MWTAHARAAPLEQAVKASFLFKFAPFVEWPDNGAGAGKPFTICVVGEDPFGATLDEVVRGQRISGRSVNVRRLGDSGNAAGCQMLFAGRSSSAGYAPFAAVAGQPVLTVSDQKSGVQGSMIQFVMQAGRVRFQIDEGAARSNGLVISSKLLGLAISVERK